MLKVAVIRTGFIGSVHAKNTALGSEGLKESARQNFRGLSLYKGRQILRDGLHPGWFERIEQSYYEAIGAFLKSVEKGLYRALPSRMV
jgi:myo-inositol 2-dehydrogenase / D-chiro-inositol 1-dehydrogenase